MISRRTFIQNSASTGLSLTLASFPLVSLAEKINVDKKAEWLKCMEDVFLTGFARKIYQDVLNKNAVEFANVYYDKGMLRNSRYGWYGIIGYVGGMEIGYSVDSKIKSLPTNLDVMKVANDWTIKLQRVASGDLSDIPNFVEELKIELENVDKL